MSKNIDIFTIGFTKKNAETFFGLLKDSGVKTLLDVRLNNVSQLAGFAKRDDLKFLLKELCGIDYVHIPHLAPTKQILDGFKKGTISWEEYEVQFRSLLLQRGVEELIQPGLLENGCLMCSEHEPDFCHRRLVVDYLSEHSGLKFNVKHLY
ncbi:DUF488 family protein [Vibrio vulnificus]